MACTKVLEQPDPPHSQPVSTGVATTYAKNPAGCQRGSVGGDLECLVCREPYSCIRPPKLLGCQHAFCAVCLKLLLCVQDNTWSIICPLCRKVTAVPGGLICNLRDQHLMGVQLARPDPEVRLCPQGLVEPATSTAGHLNLIGEDGQDAMSANRMAARRLAAHLLLLILLIILILPFVYPGVIWWVLTFIIGLAFLMAIIFCCHPSSQGCCWPCSRTIFCRERKQGQISSVA
ncbi:E3 ubiquitin-protein ligase RNF186 [Orycteropus afer afer]|uniref:E3 ubiquitin-protein ligase RNF186 n=1 Tax=Orycteropus afer afer TaxID=1230840 RepID=A0A8B6ZIG9_ORYAF|nr:E3 ubiquitin-protein ligase RNF186 [Orycteropus afer afer]